MRIVFIGTGEIGVPTQRALQKSEHEVVGIVTQPDKPVGREQKITPPAIKTALAGSNIPILQPAKIKDPQSIEEIRALSPDVVVVMAYGQILPRTALEIPKLACLNLHASLLPRWRGAAPIQAAIAAGDRETGITVMYMDEGLDTGDILLQRKIDIVPDETGGSLHDRLGEIAPEALLESLRLLESGIALRTPQDNSLATLAPKLNREHGRIDWKEPAEAIERKIRAFDPWPGAFTEISGANLKIFSATIVDLNGKPGEILRRERELVIAAGDRALSLGEVQAEGRRRMNAAEFLRGERWIGRSAGDAK
jgi:methionyl-tRNA formyltransferase